MECCYFVLTEIAIYSQYNIPAFCHAFCSNLTHLSNSSTAVCCFIKFCSILWYCLVKQTLFCHVSVSFYDKRKLRKKVSYLYQT